MSGPSAKALLLREVADELAPAKTLGRLAERSRSTVPAVGVVASVLAAVGVLGVDRLPHDGPARPLATAAVVASVLALLLALTHLQVRTDQLRRRNLAEVEQWLDRELRRAGLVVGATRLLLFGCVLAAAAAAAAVLTGGPTAAVALQLTGTRDTAVAVQVAVTGGDPGARYAVQVRAAGAPAPLLVGALVADVQGKATLDADVADSGPQRAVTVEVRTAADDLLASVTAGGPELSAPGRSAAPGSR